MHSRGNVAVRRQLLDYVCSLGELEYALRSYLCFVRDSLFPPADFDVPVYTEILAWMEIERAKHEKQHVFFFF